MITKKCISHVKKLDYKNLDYKKKEIRLQELITRIYRNVLHTT